MELTRRRQVQILSGVIALVVIAVVVTFTQFLPPPVGPIVATFVGLLSYRMADEALDSIFGEKKEGLPPIDPMLRVRYYDSQRQRIEENLKSEQTSKDFVNFPNALAFVRALPLIERKDARLKKSEGRLHVSQDSLYIGDDIEARAALPRVEQFVEFAVDMMTLPEDTERWGVPITTQPEPAPSFAAPVSDARLGALRGAYASIIIHLFAFEHWVGEFRGLTPQIQSFVEYEQSNPVHYGEGESTNHYFRRIDSQRKDYEVDVAAEGMLREYQLAVDKMKGSIIPAFQSTFPNQLEDVSKAARTYIESAANLMSKSGFYYAAVGLKAIEESTLVLQATENLRRLFPKDEAVKALADALKQEYWFMRERLTKVVDKKRTGLGF